MTNQTLAIQYLLKSLDIAYTITEGENENPPSWAKPNWGIKNTRSYRVLLSRNNQCYGFDFHQHASKEQPPIIADCIYSLYADTDTLIDNLGFENWATNLGLNPDSISDRETYKQVLTNAVTYCDVFSAPEQLILETIFTDY